MSQPSDYSEPIFESDAERAQRIAQQTNGEGGFVLLQPSPTRTVDTSTSAASAAAENSYPADQPQQKAQSPTVVQTPQGTVPGGLPQTYGPGQQNVPMPGMM